jgi:3'-phosphoadenosine 5'-phosphosulfate sulfotransferase (PAPS reductase)/FAD synthetase
MLEWADAPEGETKLTFVEKERRVKDIMKDSIVNAENPVVCFSRGKKSLVLLHLLKQNCDSALNVLHIDTTVEFELYIEKMQKLWQFNLLRERRG